MNPQEERYRDDYNRLDKHARLSLPIDGMSLRDYFAGQALAYFHPVGSDATPDIASRALAKAAYTVADAMLAERAK